MIQKFKKSKFKKTIAIYLAMMILLETIQPMVIYALTSGPTQPEFNAFTPIGTSDMVDLASGDFNYNIPIMNVGGYPLNLAYNSGITMDQEASWTGLGWNLNVGQISRQIRGLPDDFKGDEVVYDNDLKDNITVGTHFGLNAAVFGINAIKPGVGLGVEYNNYEGISFKPSFGIGFKLSDNVTVGLDVSSSVADGATVAPKVSISGKLGEKINGTTSEGLKGSGSLGLGFNSRKGVENLNLSASVTPFTSKLKTETAKTIAGGGSISFNNQSFTPSKRVGFDTRNFTFNGALGAEFVGFEPQMQLTGYGSYQGISSAYKHRAEKAFGYDYTEHKKSQSGVLDFNRENERTVNQNTTALPLTNYTYDIYNIEGQGVSGMFRPYRSKVSYLYNDNVSDNGVGVSLGLEFGAGNLVHKGVDFKVSPSNSHTGGWFKNNNVVKYFKEENTDSKSIDYEPTTFKLVGSMVVDPEQTIYENKIYRTKALQFGLDGGNRNRVTTPHFFPAGGSPQHAINSDIKRTKRFMRNQLVQKVTKTEAAGDKLITANSFANGHHTAGIKVTQTDGTRYVYGNAIYNTQIIEATFDVSNSGNVVDHRKGLVGYNGTLSGNNSGNSDKFLNKITTPAYAHSYLLTSILSSDYQDVDDNGPSINDLGNYTNFDYRTTESNYQWRVPFGLNKATYNEGLTSHKDDQKGNYIYGKKELKYLSKIVTKTHVAFFDLEDRKDAIGVNGEHGGAGSGRMQKLKSIRLYSITEVTNNTGQIVDPLISLSNVKPIKTAHFIYNYSLCKNIPNNTNSTSLTTNETSNLGGKLTLERVYFTYRGSNMGKYTPYVFNYGNLNDTLDNPDYDNKEFDIWGNYKANPISSGGVLANGLSTTEYPFVSQNQKLVDDPDPVNKEENQRLVDKNASAWNLKLIKLPSGGEITVKTESDDYQYVQNKKAMQMFKVIGAGNSSVPSTNNKLYNGSNHATFIYVKISDQQLNINRQQFIDHYLSQNYDKYIKFRFLMNMTGNSWQYDFVSGYFKIGETSGRAITIRSDGTGTIAAIPLQMLTLDGGTNANASVNPIAKTGWGFGRTYLNRAVYSLGGNTNNTNFASIVKDLVGSFKAISEIFNGPNLTLQNKGCARTFRTDKSWIRLENFNGRKLGGGLRVKSITLSDNWQNMLVPNGGSSLPNMEYGQEYKYDDGKGKSSGVATFEPNSSDENALLEPFYPKSGGYADKIAAPIENNYVEKPFGENFFPSSKVTYSKVTVKSLDHKDGNRIVKKHATGNVVTEHYTTYDFPTKVEHTPPKAHFDILDGRSILGMLNNLANIRVRNHITMTQGYSIVTNDMNGKTKSQKVYGEGQQQPISSVEYKYNIDINGEVDNNLTTVDEKGRVAKRLIGLDYDMINDFNESESETRVTGFDGNLAVFLIAIFPGFVPTVLPRSSYHQNLLRTAVTTKHVHKTAILKEKIAYDLGAKVSTKNLAWDASSGEVILTETINEYGDNYYAFNYPAYWMYAGMGLASQNIGVEGQLQASTPITLPSPSPDPSANPYFNLVGYTNTDLTTVFHLGDELYSSQPGGIVQSGNASGDAILNKVWVVGFTADKKGILLMDRKGNYVNQCEDNDKFPFKIVRSGYRNLQTASMASVTSMINPIKITNAVTGEGTLDQNSFIFDGSSTSNPRIINASAVAYKDYWHMQLESDLPYYPEYNQALSYTNPVDQNGNVVYPYDVRVNPYVWNIKGNWKAEKSYAYLTGRNSAAGTINNPRNEGFFKNFTPFYQYNSTTGTWFTNLTNWTFASSVTKHSPFGAELENKDALNRYSAAQYGYNYTMPMAVASNAKYQQMGFEGFEEVRSRRPDKHFVFNHEQNSASTQHSHTGKYSLKVNRGQSSVLQKHLKPVIRNIVPAVCPISDPVDEGCDGNGGHLEFVFVCYRECDGCPDCGDKSVCCVDGRYEYICIPAGSRIARKDRIYISKEGIPFKIKS